MCSNLLRATFLCGLNALTMAHANPFFVADGFTFSAAIGASQFKKSSPQQLVISDFVTDLLVPTGERQHRPGYNFQVKKKLAVSTQLIKKLTVGAGFYYQQSRYIGQVWELQAPLYYNFNYAYGTNNSSVLVESDLYFRPIAFVHPYLTLGAGLSRVNTRYDDYALPTIPVNDESHWAHHQTKGTFELGAGLTVPVDKYWSMSVRYAYFYLPKSNPLFPRPPHLILNPANQTVFLGVNYSL